MRPVVGLRPGTLCDEGCENSIGKPEQLQALVDEVWAEIVPEARPCARLLAPSDADLWSIAIEVRLEMRDVAEHRAGDQISEGEKVAVPPAIVKHGKHLAGP